LGPATSWHVCCGTWAPTSCPQLHKQMLMLLALTQHLWTMPRTTRTSGTPPGWEATQASFLGHGICHVTIPPGHLQSRIIVFVASYVTSFMVRRYSGVYNAVTQQLSYVVVWKPAQEGSCSIYNEMQCCCCLGE